MVVGLSLQVFTFYLKKIINAFVLCVELLRSFCKMDNAHLPLYLSSELGFSLLFQCEGYVTIKCCLVCAQHWLQVSVASDFVLL